MLNVFDYIRNYCEVHKYNNVSYKSCVLTKDGWQTEMSFAPGVAFFFKVRAAGEIHDIADLSKPFLTVETPTDIWDFAHIGNVHDDGAVQRFESDFVFVCDGMMKNTLSEGASALFARIDTLQMFYIYVSILPDDAATADGNKRVYDIQINRKQQQTS